MNTLIRKLWLEAATASAYYPSGQNNSWETQVNFLDRFAKLIVRESVQLLDENDGATHHKELLFEHFGVEE